MNICWLSPNYPTLETGGGIGTYAMYAARGLAARGHRCSVVIPVWGRASATHRDGPIEIHERWVRQLPLVGRRLLGLGEAMCLLWHVCALHRGRRFDVIEVPNYEGWGFLLSRLLPRRVVIRFHTSRWAIAELRGDELTFGEKFNHWLDRSGVRAARTLCTHSRFEWAHAQEENGLAAAEAAIVPHGIELPPKEALLELCGDTANPTVLYVGRMEYRKGSHMLVEAIPRVLAEFPSARFVLVGEDKPQAPGGRLFADYFRETCPREYWGKVEFTGYVSDERLRDLLRTCDLFVAPSLSESFGYTHLEAMSWGKAVIGCRAGATPEIVIQGEVGLLAEPNNAADLAAQLLTLLNDPSLRVRMGKAARARAEREYSVERMAENLERFYARCLKQRR